MGTYRNFGPLGLIVLLFGLIAGILSGDWTSLYVLAHLILGAMLLGLYLFTHVENLRETVGGRRGKYGINAIVYTGMTLTVIVIINYLAVQHPVRWDVTEQGIFSLALQSQQLLDALETDVVARGFYREGEEAATRDVLESFAAASDRFTYEFVDPDKQPEVAEQFEIAQYGTVHLSVGEETSKLTEVTEESITNTLIRLTSAGRKTAYFVIGHGEPDLDDSTTEMAFGQAKAALDNEGYEVVPLVLGSVPDVPGDADLLLVAGPQRPFIDREIESLSRYIKRGGSAMIMIDPQQSDELLPVMQNLGIELGNDVIIEQFVQLFAGATLGLEPIVGDYGAHPITAGFGERTIFRLARSVSAAEELPDGVRATDLVLTSGSSWAETDLARLFDSGEVELDDVDTEGPISIAVAATLTGAALDWTAPLIATAPGADTAADSSTNAEEEAPSAEEDAPTAVEDGPTAEENAPTAEENAATEAPPGLEGRLVVFGDSLWLTNRYLNNYFNEDLFLNAVGWLAGEEQLISIRPRRTRASQVLLTANESRSIFYITVLLLPELILFFGMFVWLKRRNR